MPRSLDHNLHWTDHYVEHGFAVVKRVVGDEFIRPALDEVRRLRQTDLPFNQWTNKPHSCHLGYDGKNMSVLPTIYDQPGVRHVIDTMLGGPRNWSGERAFQLFVSAYDADAKAELGPAGHIDFVDCPVPSIGSGFMFQVSLIDAEPFSGNITIYPDGHRAIQKRLIENPEARYPSDPVIIKALEAEPYEFAAQAGDMLLFHHLVGHGGNLNHAAGRTPRIVLHCQGQLNHWPREVDPANIRFGPWERSMALNGRHRPLNEEQEWITNFRRQRATAKAQPAAAAS